MSEAIIFDFDGTLVDSEKAIYECFQTITNYLAPERIDYAQNILIGPPLRDTASEILGPNHQKQLSEFVKLFIEMHDEHAIKNTQPYPGVIETLKILSSKENMTKISINNFKNKPMKLLIQLIIQKIKKILMMIMMIHYFNLMKILTEKY